MQRGHISNTNSCIKALASTQHRVRCSNVESLNATLRVRRTSSLHIRQFEGVFDFSCTQRYTHTGHVIPCTVLLRTCIGEFGLEQNIWFRTSRKATLDGASEMFVKATWTIIANFCYYKGVIPFMIIFFFLLRQANLWRITNGGAVILESHF